MQRTGCGMSRWQFCVGTIICFLCIFFLIHKNPGITECMNQSVVTEDRLEETIPQSSAEQPGELKKVAITFDDGPHEIYTPLLLDGLAQRKVHATFFVTGENVEKYPDIIQRMDTEGHLIGNHTYHHIQLTNTNGDVFYEELKKTNEVISQITKKDVEYVRPPFGSWNKKYEQELNMFPVLWNIDPMDWCSNDTDCIVRHVLERVQDNSIILLHDEYDSSIAAALQIIDQLQKEDYEFVTVDQMLVN